LDGHDEVHGEFFAGDIDNTINGGVDPGRIEILMGNGLKDMRFSKTHPPVYDQGIEGGSTGIVGNGFGGGIGELVGMSDNEGIEGKTWIDMERFKERIFGKLERRGGIRWRKSRCGFGGSIFRRLGKGRRSYHKPDEDIMPEQGAANRSYKRKIVFFEPTGEILLGNGNDQRIIRQFIQRERFEPGIETLDIHPFLNAFQETVPENVFFKYIHSGGKRNEREMGWKCIQKLQRTCLCCQANSKRKRERKKSEKCAIL
jgi:hypothetical protein